MTLLYIIYFLAILIHLTSILITGIFVIPLQLKEAKVKNGLAKLRIQLLFFGIDCIIISLISIIILSLPFFPFSRDLIRLIITFLVLTHSLGFLSYSVIGYFMYHQQYSLLSKKHHIQIAKLEEEENKLKIDQASTTKKSGSLTSS